MAKVDNTHLESSKLFDVSHLVAVVTGGGSGIGLMITQVMIVTQLTFLILIFSLFQTLVVNGAKVYIIDRREDALQTVVDLYNSGPGQIIPQVMLFSSCSIALTLSSSIDWQNAGRYQ